jgi:hypothetical protein
VKESKIFSVISFLLLFSFVNTANSEPRNVLIEYYSGTWCGNCPCAHQALSDIKNTYPQTIALSYHGGGNDPWQNFNGDQVRTLLGFSASAAGIIDRKSNQVGYSSWMTRVSDRYANSQMSPVNLNVTAKSFNSVTRTLDMTIDATALENLTGQYKISFVLTEDNLVYPQNYYAQCGTPGYVNNYVHSHVVRSMLNGASGENLNSGAWNQNEAIAKNISTVLDAAWIPENCRVVIFIYKESASLALSNVQQAIEESVIGTTGISGNSGIVESYSLSQNYPNPFNPATAVSFTIPKAGNVSFKVFDSKGSEVRNYLNTFLQSGTYNVQIEGSDLTSGVYFYELRTDDFREAKRMILLK